MYPKSKNESLYYFISFGRNKEWYFWLLKSREEAPDHFTNFRISAKAVEERLSKENTPLKDHEVLKKIVVELIQSEKYLAITFPFANIGLDYFSYTKTKRIFKYYPEFPVLEGHDNVDMDYLLFYSTSLYYADEFKLSLFKADPKIPSLIQTLSRKILERTPYKNQSIKFLHDVIISKLKKKGFEQVGIDTMEFYGLSHHREGLSYEWWEDFFTKEFLEKNLRTKDNNHSQSFTPF